MLFFKSFLENTNFEKKGRQNYQHAMSSNIPKTTTSLFYYLVKVCIMKMLSGKQCIPYREQTAGRQAAGLQNKDFYVQLPLDPNTAFLNVIGCK